MVDVTGTRVLVCGGRYYDDRRTVDAVMRVAAFIGIQVVIHGACHTPVNADKMAGAWAEARGYPVDEYPVDTSIEGPWPAAGNRRNGRMMRASMPDLVIAFPGQRGTANMVTRAKRAGVPVWDIPETGIGR